MKKANLKEEQIDLDDIMVRTNGGYDIYRYYIGKVQRSMHRPWGKRESKASWGVFPSRGGIWVWKDLATEEKGNAIHLVERLFNLNFLEAVDKIRNDFNLKPDSKPTAKKIVTWEPPSAEEKEYCEIKFHTQPFTKRNHEFWNIAEVTEEHCRSKNCFSVKTLAVNSRFVPIKDGENVFAFYCPEEDSVKIYFPDRKEDRFKNNVSYNYLWNFSNLQPCDDLIIQKSPKDMIVTSMITPNVTATQAEAAEIFNEDTVNKIIGICPTPIVWYGSDPDGVKKCKKITDVNHWRYVNTPKLLLPEINDTYGYAAKYGLKGLEDFMKLKKILKN